MRSIVSISICRVTKRRCFSTYRRGRREGGMIIRRQQDVTVAAISAMEQTSNPRLREIMVSLVKHLHGFVREARLTEAEFREATAILAELGGNRPIRTTKS